MSRPLSLHEARELFGADFFGPDVVARALGETPAPRDGASESTAPPFSRADAEAARKAGGFLIHRPATLAGGAALTLAVLHQRCNGSSAAAAMRFRSDDPWFLGQAFAESETPEAGWALAIKEPWRATLNQTYDRASEALADFPGGAAATPWRRRRAVEIVLDCLVVAAVRGERLLSNAWDWSSSSAADGGLINVGGFGAGGLEVLSYSKAVKHGALGICPTLVAR